MSRNARSLNLLEPLGLSRVQHLVARAICRPGFANRSFTLLYHTHVWSHTHYTCQVTNTILLRYFRIIKVIQLVTLQLHRLFKKPLFVLLLHWWSRLSPLLRKRTITLRMFSIRAPWRVSISCQASFAIVCELPAGHETSSGWTARSAEFYVLPTQCIVRFVWIWEQTASISLYSVNCLVFVTETECVYCAVRTGCLYIIQV